MSHPESTTAHAPEPERDRRTGKWKPGGASPNPGGLTREHRATRAAFLERVPRALELVDLWLESGDFEQQRAAVETTLLRGLGKPSKASEMPALEAPPEVRPEQADAGVMLLEVRDMLARGIATAKQQQQAGELGMEGLESLGRLGQAIGALLKAEAEASRASKLSALSVDELLALVPEETLRAALEKRGRA